jgi:hypothetical protein
MTFDVIIGNPPYQLTTGGTQSQATPLYHHFVKMAKKTNPKYLVMITPSRWFAGGMGLDSFREEMLNDDRLKVIVDYPNAKDCFPNISIGGGVNYFLWARDYHGKCLYSNIHNSKVSTEERILNEFPVFVRYNMAINIIHKILKLKEKNLSEIISSLSPFGLGSAERGHSHFQTGDIASSWKPSSNIYEVQSLTVNNIQDFFTLLPGDLEHQMFEFLQGDIRVQQYIDSFKFCDYQIIQMANLSPATFGYEKDSYQNVASIDLNANLTEMTIEAIKRQLEPQINNLIKNIVILQTSQNMTENLIPNEIVWDFGSNERFDDMKKLSVLQAIQRTARVPYSYRAKIITPILNKLIDETTDEKDLIQAYKDEEKDIAIDFGEV